MTAPAPTPTPASTINQDRASTMHSHFQSLASPPVTTHLTDGGSKYILSTHPHPHSPALASLSAAFIQAHDTASRMKLGQPLRVTLSTFSGAAVIQTGTSGERSSRPASGDDEEYTGGGVGAGMVEGVGGELLGGAGGGNGARQGMLVGTVIAPGDRMAEARMASWGVEEVAKRFQKSAGDGQ
ncbi:hypothetical protein RUND412_009503 [Rhizina undulata]